VSFDSGRRRLFVDEFRKLRLPGLWCRLSVDVGNRYVELGLTSRVLSVET